ncbi:hypothetical protein SMICM17S_04951 [Streptomyces microflavus]
MPRVRPTRGATVRISFSWVERKTRTVVSSDQPVVVDRLVAGTDHIAREGQLGGEAAADVLVQLA